MNERLRRQNLATSSASLLDASAGKCQKFVLVVWWLLCLPLYPKVEGSNPAKAMDFKGDKNKQHTFLWMGSKVGGPMS
jgi:hypothetical protein